MRVHLILFAAAALAACHRDATPDAKYGDISVATLPQGWSNDDRGAFYTTVQGSHLMPAKWFAALRRPDGSTRFAADQLARFGYLPTADGSNLPVGFVVDPPSGDVGMTCAACHTGQITWKGQSWRIDGGRASADFGAFLTELVASARATEAAPERLDAFAAEAAGTGATAQDIAAIKTGFQDWTQGFGNFLDRSLPGTAWGPGRADAFGMIFNRLTGLDLGIEANIRPADAPVRYPFLWDATFQDRTQWDGAAPNGSFVSALARNTGEVFGVFGHFNPNLIAPHFVIYANSVEFRNLQLLEQQIRKLKAPAWPKAAFGLNETLVAQGKPLFDANCAACHGLRPSKSVPGAWATPVCRVGTDPLMYQNALLTADSGKLAGTVQLAGGGFLAARDKKVAILANAVVGSLLLDAAKPDTGIWRAINADAADRLAPGHNIVAGPQLPLPAECGETSAEGQPAAATGDSTKQIAAATKDLYKMPAAGPAAAAGAAAYEARVLTGIWAVAPYLHNGSVASLADLLKPTPERARIIPAATQDYDPVNVGVAAPPAGAPATSLDTPGNSNMGHEYGTHLPPDERAALLEYLKTL